MNSSTGLCPSCEASIIGSQRRADETQTRQSQARASAYNQNRVLTSPQSSDRSGATTAIQEQPSIPSMDLSSLQQTYGEMISSGDQPKFQSDIYGMLLNIMTKQSATDTAIQDIDNNKERIRELEAKVGGPEEISTRLALSIKKLPLPREGYTELDNVREALAEIRAPGVNPYTDVVKAVRVGCKEDYLGLVKVEMKNDFCRSAIMTNKKNLEHHPNPTTKGLIIKNLRSEEHLFSSNFANDILKMIPGGENVYVSGNGRLRQRETPRSFASNSSFQRPPAQQLQPHAVSQRSGYSFHNRFPFSGYAANSTRHQQPRNPTFNAPQLQTYSSNANTNCARADVSGASNESVLAHSVPHNPASEIATFVTVPPPSAVQSAVNPLDTFDPFGSIHVEARSDQDSQPTDFQPNNIIQLGPGRLGQEVIASGSEGPHRPE